MRMGTETAQAALVNALPKIPLCSACRRSLALKFARWSIYARNSGETRENGIQSQGATSPGATRIAGNSGEDAHYRGGSVFWRRHGNREDERSETGNLGQNRSRSGQVRRCRD